MSPFCKKIMLDGADAMLSLRYANDDDVLDIFNWRNDLLALEMTLRQDVVSLDAHKQWFKDTLDDKRVVMLIGLANGERIGVCRFSMSNDGDYTDLSINMNPVYRGKGLGQIFLKQAITVYTRTHTQKLFARIKNSNQASISIFKKCDFSMVLSNALFSTYQHRASCDTFVFEKIINTDRQIDILYSLLQKRTHSISHVTMPSLHEHRNFVLSDPYEAWFLVRMNQNFVGSLYIKDENTVGINLVASSLEIVCACLNHINKNFSPRKAKPSFIPAYFVVNVASSNTTFQQNLKILGYDEVQTTFRLNQP